MKACAALQGTVDFELPPLPMPRSRDDDSSVLYGVGPLVTQEVNLDAFLHALVDRVTRAMGADRGTLWLVDPARGELFSRAAHLPEVKQIRVKLGQGAAGQVVTTNAPVKSPDEAGGSRVHGDVDKLTGYQTKCLLAVPLNDGHPEPFGVLQVLNKLGAKSFDDDDLARLQRMAGQVSEALERTSLLAELRRARAQPQSPVGYWFNHVIGESKPMKAAYRVVQKAAETQATVLLRGESGTGKELFARAVHVNSRRRDGPFVKVDCAALPAALVENELFGHEKGAFTGAESRALGKFEVAKGGTVFIDELGELPLAVQGKLLRVLQDRELERLGGHQTVPVDVRIVAATNRDLPAMVKQGTFREDLYYRVKVVEVRLPALRERGPEDVERLARHFVAHATRRHHLAKAPHLTPAALTRLLAWHWPGNVRELEHCIESAVVLCDGEILPEHLALPDPALAPAGGAEPAQGSLALADAERRHIAFVLEKVKGNKSQAAELLGIGRNTLLRKLKAFGL